MVGRSNFCRFARRGWERRVKEQHPSVLEYCLHWLRALAMYVHQAAPLTWGVQRIFRAPPLNLQLALLS
jgi:hypothetical protein